jgi:Sec-independent protein translocase protein TatA
MSSEILILTIIALVAIGISGDLRRRRVARELASLIRRNRERADSIERAHRDDAEAAATLSWYSGALGALTIARALVRGERRRSS